MLRVLFATNTDDYEHLVAVAAAGAPVPRWAAPKAAAPRDPVALCTHDKGFVARARIASAPVPGTFGKRVVYRADISNVELLPLPVPLAYIKRELPSWAWTTSVSKGYTTPLPDVARSLLDLLDDYQDDCLDPPGVATFAEGNRYRTQVLRYERNAAARAACIQHHGCACAVCGLVLAEQYGEVAGSLVVVHHLEPISTKAAAYVLDPIRHLRPVCANCHLVMHRRKPPYTVKEVRAMMTSGSTGK